MKKIVSVVVPCYNESGNLEAFYDRARKVFDQDPDQDWELIFVDDHSSDGSDRSFRAITENDARVRWIRLAQNSGSHVAIRAGLAAAKGDSAALIAADLQDPPEILSGMVRAWSSGSAVVWAARRRRKGESVSTILCSNLYHFFMEKAAGVHIPPSGSDALLIDRKAIDRLNTWKDRETSVFLYVASLGLTESKVEYDKEPRHSGRSKWSLKKKWKLFIDSVYMFGNLPTRAFGAIGVLAVAAGSAFAALQRPVVSAALFVTAFAAFSAAVIAEYLRRILQKRSGGDPWSLERSDDRKS